MRTRTEITLEMDRWIVVNRSKKKRWCSVCAQYVEMMTVDDAALFEQMNSIHVSVGPLNKSYSGVERNTDFSK